MSSIRLGAAPHRGVGEETKNKENTVTCLKLLRRRFLFISPNIDNSFSTKEETERNAFESGIQRDSMTRRKASLR